MAIEELTHLERMPDPMDEASQIEQLTVSAAVAKIRAQVAANGDSRADCLDCGDDIPPARQKAVAGVQRCVPCADLLHKREQGVRRI